VTTKQHKWHKEIKAWADGAEIEYRNIGFEDWASLTNIKPSWEADEYRIKPQPKEPQYLYVYKFTGQYGLEIRLWNEKTGSTGYMGKIKLEEES